MQMKLNMTATFQVVITSHATNRRNPSVIDKKHQNNPTKDRENKQR